MASTRLGLMKETLREIECGNMLGIDAPVRLDEIEVAEDLFGMLADSGDLIIDRMCTAVPTGDRTWSSYDREDDGILILNTHPDYILD